jgi:hypothetical protein
VNFFIFHHATSHFVCLFQLIKRDSFYESDFSSFQPCHAIKLARATGGTPSSKGADCSLYERMKLEDQIMERALALWRKRGRGHRNALDALHQVKCEVLAQTGAGKSRIKKF